MGISRNESTITEASLGSIDNTLAVNAYQSADHASHSRADEQLLTVHDTARFLNVSVSWVYEHTRDDADDRLPFVKLGKYLRFDCADLRAYVDAKRASARTARRKR
jgi:excisionase family DNA binding protein